MKQVNVSKCLVTLLISLTALCGYAQDSYREAIKDYFHLNCQADQMESALKELNMILFDDSGMNLSQLTERYIQECLTNDYADYMEPKMKAQNVTEAELREVVELLSTPAGKAYNEHQLEWIDNMKGELTSIMLQNMGQIMYGDLSKPIQPKAEIDAVYIEKFKEVMGNSMIESFMNVFDMTGPNTNPIQLPDELKERLQTWLSVNLPTITMNSAYGTITVEDLDFAAKLASHESYSKMQDFSFMNYGQIGPLVTGMLSNYVDWMQVQGAVVKGHADTILKMMQGDD